MSITLSNGLEDPETYVKSCNQIYKSKNLPLIHISEDIIKLSKDIFINKKTLAQTPSNPTPSTPTPSTPTPSTPTNTLKTTPSEPTNQHSPAPETLNPSLNHPSSTKTPTPASSQTPNKSTSLSVQLFPNSPTKDEQYTKSPAKPPPPVSSPSHFPKLHSTPHIKKASHTKSKTITSPCITIKSPSSSSKITPEQETFEYTTVATRAQKLKSKN